MWIVISILILIFCLVAFKKIQDKKALEQDRKLLEQVTKSHRGTRSERNLILRLLKDKIPAQTIFHDLYLKKSNGHFSQIDLVIPTKIGIIVFEIKDFNGWIFGNGRDQQWTQVLAYGKEKYRFYNPIMQNNRHIDELKKQLKQCGNIPFYSVIVFYGDCVLKDISFVPDRTYIVKANRVTELINNILHNNSMVTYTNKHEIVRILKEAMLNGEDIDIQVQHVKNIENIIGRHRVFD